MIDRAGMLVSPGDLGLPDTGYRTTRIFGNSKFSYDGSDLQPNSGMYMRPKVKTLCPFSSPYVIQNTHLQ